ncbi:hypothetical protein [Absidia glauca]|uniref:Reticulon-like protein n=1 Tax=Absidia glauca TaxID=4829 RepID=A0A168P858_ABSGL|nr:hypothetical protein [Absidia glauca]
MMDILSPSFTNGHKYMGKSNVTTATTPAEGIALFAFAAPSPRLSMDEATLALLMEDRLLQETKQVEKHEDEEQVVPAKKPVIDTSREEPIRTKNFPYQSPTAVEFTHDPSAYLINQTKSLIYWEYPLQSASVLCLTLGSTWLTRYYSLLYLVSGAFTVITFFNWMYVNVHYHSYRILSGKSADAIQHPHGERLHIQKRRAWFTEAQVDHACHVVMDVVEGLVKQVVDLVLIEDSGRSGIAVLVSFLVWTLASWLSMKTLVMIFTLVLFVVPRLYLEHQESVDMWCQVQNQKAQGWLKQHQAQCQVWLRQYHILGQHLVNGLLVVYQSLHRVGLLAFEKQQQWAKQRQLEKQRQLDLICVHILRSSPGPPRCIVAGGHSAQDMAFNQFLAEDTPTSRKQVKPAEKDENENEPDENEPDENEADEHEGKGKKGKETAAAVSNSASTVPSASAKGGKAPESSSNAPPLSSSPAAATMISSAAPGKPTAAPQTPTSSSGAAPAVSIAPISLESLSFPAPPKAPGSASGKAAAATGPAASRGLAHRRKSSATPSFTLTPSTFLLTVVMAMIIAWF